MAHGCLGVENKGRDIGARECNLSARPTGEARPSESTLFGQNVAYSGPLGHATGHDIFVLLPANEEH